MFCAQVRCNQLCLFAEPQSAHGQLGGRRKGSVFSPLFGAHEDSPTSCIKKQNLFPVLKTNAADFPYLEKSIPFLILSLFYNCVIYHSFAFWDGWNSFICQSSYCVYSVLLRDIVIVILFCLLLAATEHYTKQRIYHQCLSNYRSMTVDLKIGSVAIHQQVLPSWSLNVPIFVLCWTYFLSLLMLCPVGCPKKSGCKKTNKKMCFTHLPNFQHQHLSHFAQFDIIWHRNYYEYFLFTVLRNN